ALALICQERELRQTCGEEMPAERYLNDFADIREWLELNFALEAQAEVQAPGWTPPSSPTSACAPPGVAGYEVLDELARGGMGVIWRVRDLELCRCLALKVLHKEHLADPARVLRFEEEARVTAQLQHPGIPWVYRRGKLPTGQPYFA